MPVGRLDKDTAGLLLFTTDGQLNHALTSPRRGVWKEYEAEVEGPLGPDEAARFREGIQLQDFTALPAELRVLRSGSHSTAAVRVHEGKYHQVRRMFAACERPVLTLRRTVFGPIALPDDLTAFVEGIAEEKQLDTSLTLSLNLALEEAVVNAILYAYPEGMEGLVEIEALIRDNTVHFIVSDSGRPVDPTQMDDEEDLNRILDDRTNNALGIYMVRNIMDTVYYERADGRNCLHMTKKLD